MTASSHSARVIDFRYAPPIAFTSICRPDDPYKTLVRQDGALLYDFQAPSFESWHFRRVIEFRLRSRGGPQKIRQVTESARVPVVVTSIDYPRATLTMRAFGHQDDRGRRTDIVLWEVTTHEAQAGTPKAAKDFLAQFKVEIYENGRIFAGRSPGPVRAIFSLPFDAARESFGLDLVTKTWTEDPAAPAPGPIVLVSDPLPLSQSHTDGFRPATALATEPAPLRPGESIRGAIMVPANHGDYDHLDYGWAVAALEEERAFWNGLPQLDLPFSVPDPSVMDMVMAAARNILQAREVVGGVPVFQVGPTIYRGLWVVDGHFLLEAGQYLGLRDDAYKGVDVLLRRVRDDGSIIEMPFHTKETGISLATLVRQTELVNDDDRLVELWPVVQRAVAYIETLRSEAYNLPPDAPNYGLLPDSFADGGIGSKRAEYTTPLWTLVGLKAVAESARRLGEQEDAAHFQQVYDELMADFMRCYARDKKLHASGASYLPQWMPGSADHLWNPEFEGEVPAYRRLNPQSGTWALEQAIYPGEIFGPDHEIVQEHCRLLDAVDDEEGMPQETGWVPYQGLWNYQAGFAAEAMLYAGHPDKAVDYLYAMANHAAPTRVWREEQSLVASDNADFVGDMPHNWASAEFVRLVRHLLVFERGDTLELLPALPPEWLRPGAEVRVDRTPTRFGPVTLHLRCEAQGKVTLSYSLDGAWPRKPACIRVRIPQGVGEMIVNGAAHDSQAGSWADL
ncbi:MAG: hypothetical protein U0X20_09755 [Caldilineaceae bacterium]